MSSVPFMRLTDHALPAASVPAPAAPAPAPSLATGNSQPATPHRPRGPMWIDLPTAAQRSGVGEGHLRRLCGDRWMALGLAKMEQPGDGRKAIWFVREDADARFAPVKFPEQLDQRFDPRVLTEEQRAEVDRMKLILDDWLEARAGGTKLGFTEGKVTAQFLLCLEANKGIRLSRSTLFNWLRAYRRDGKAGLIDERWNVAGADEAGPAKETHPFLDYVQRLWLGPRRYSLADCVMIAEQKATDEGWDFASLGRTKAALYKRCQRHINGLPPQLKIRRREGEKAFIDKCEPAIRRDYSTIFSNDYWCGDDHTFDVMVKVPDGKGGFRHVRPTISAWEDCRSRKIVGWTITAEAGNADTILKAFAMGARSHGLPNNVYIDNGKAYDARTLQGRTKSERREGAQPRRLEGVWPILDVKVAHCWPYHGQSKPIERAFGTVCMRFAKFFDTYTGRNTLEKPKDRVDEDFLQKQLDAGKAPTLEEFTAEFSAWLESVYHSTVHQGDAMDGRTPAQAFEQELRVKRVVDEDLLRFAILPRYGPLKVGKQGVTWKGLCFGGFDAAVQKLYGKKVLIAVDNDHLASVLVLDLEGKLLAGKASANIKLPFDSTSEDLRAATKMKKQLRKTMREYQEHRPRMSDDVQQLARRSAQRRLAEKTAAAGPQAPLPPPSLKPHQTPFDDQLEAVRTVFEQPQKLAVGAESLGPSVSERFTYASPQSAEDVEEKPSFMNLVREES